MPVFRTTVPCDGSNSRLHVRLGIDFRAALRRAPGRSMALPLERYGVPRRRFLKLCSVDQHLATRPRYASGVRGHRDEEVLPIQKRDETRGPLLHPEASHRGASTRKKERPPQVLISSAANVSEPDNVAR